VSLRTRLRRIWRIARWEVSLGSTSLDRQTLLAGVALLLLAGGIAGAGLALGVDGLSPTQDIYRVGIDDDSPYYNVVADHAALSPQEPDREKLETGELDLIVAPAGNSGTVSLTVGGDDGEGVVEAGALGQSTVSVAHAPTEKGTAALTSFRAAVQGYNDRLMALEPNRTAAYPVSVRLQYRPQSSPTGARGGGSSETDAGSDDGTDTEGGDGAADDGSDGSNGGSDNDQSTDDDTNDGSTGDANLDVDDERDDPDVDNDDDSLLDGLLSGGNSQGSPAEISPPFPFSSLVLAFVFLVPMNFIIQAYGGTILNERINRRGELLLVAPIQRLDIVAGKTLPYLLAAVVAITGISLGVGGGLLSVAAVLPIALAFLASTFVGAMFARSFKELTFVTVTVSVALDELRLRPGDLHERHANRAHLAALDCRDGASGRNGRSRRVHLLDCTLLSRLCDPLSARGRRLPRGGYVHPEAGAAQVPRCNRCPASRAKIGRGRLGADDPVCLHRRTAGDCGAVRHAGRPLGAADSRGHRGHRGSRQKYPHLRRLRE
jgi:ABC-type Na+ efflux pump, permease component